MSEIFGGENRAPRDLSATSPLPGSTFPGRGTAPRLAAAMATETSPCIAETGRPAGSAPAAGRSAPTARCPAWCTARAGDPSPSRWPGPSCARRHHRGGPERPDHPRGRRRRAPQHREGPPAATPSRNIIHVDFQAHRRHVEIEVEVPIVLEGDAGGGGARRRHRPSARAVHRPLAKSERHPPELDSRRVRHRRSATPSGSAITLPGGDHRGRSRRARRHRSDQPGHHRGGRGGGGPRVWRAAEAVAEGEARRARPRAAEGDASEDGVDE